VIGSLPGTNKEISVGSKDRTLVREFTNRRPSFAQSVESLNRRVVAHSLRLFFFARDFSSMFPSSPPFLLASLPFPALIVPDASRYIAIVARAIRSCESFMQRRRKRIVRFREGERGGLLSRSPA